MSPNKILKTPIIPNEPILYNESGHKSLDFKSIAVWATIGFFLDQDTFYKSEKVLKPASIYNIENSPFLQETYFKWHYTPKNTEIKQVTEEFGNLLERIVSKQTKGHQIILPLSGGLDSRTLAAALKGSNQVNAYSYEFQNGIPENKYGKQIAQAEDFPFNSFIVPKGYLWKSIERLSKINKCHAEFTNPRQMAFIDEYASMGDLFLLGHWGDVLFDNMNLPNDLSFEDQVQYIAKKIVKKGGLELGTVLWSAWGLEGKFKDYLNERIATLLTDIKIDNVNSRIRAFKSMYWAHRWTSTNLQIFSSVHPIAVPYYDNEMCHFICSIPEHLLSGRQIQIEYLKMKAPELASLPWQMHRPFNLYNYHQNRMPWNLPFRIINKSKKLIGGFSKKPFIQRNWELQFLGKNNEEQLSYWLFENSDFAKLVPEKISKDIFRKFFNEDKVLWSHPLSMLLTLSLFSKHNI